MDRRRNIPLAIFLILIFNCGGKSFSIESTSTINSENSNNNNIDTTVIKNLVNIANNGDNQKSDNTSQEFSGFNMPELFSFMDTLSNVCNNINETSNVNNNINGVTDNVENENVVNENNDAESNTDTINYRLYVEGIIQRDATMKSILCALQQYLNAVLQKARHVSDNLL